MEGLYGVNQKNQPVPKIAKSYTVSDGGRVWTFTLRTDAKWSNGAPVTAEDFYYSWMRELAPSDATGAIWASVLNYVNNAYQYHAGAVPASDVGIKVLGTYKIQLTLTGPYNPLGDLTNSGSMPVYPPVVEKFPSTWWEPAHWVGDGPYNVTAFVPNGEVTLTRNKDYVGHPGEFNVGNVQTIHVIPAPTVPVEDFESGALSAALIAATSDFKYAETNLKSETHEVTEPNLYLLEYDSSPVPSPLFNESVRRAIAMVIDRGPIANPVLNGMVTATNVFAYPGWATEKLEHGIAYDPTEAKKLLAAAGYPNGKNFPTLTLYTLPVASIPVLTPIAEVIAQQLKTTLGIKTRIVTESYNVWSDITWNGINPNIQPGYVIGNGVANFPDQVSLPLEANQHVAFDGVFGSQSFVAYAAHNWYLPAYDPIDVKALGNPTDTRLGTAYSQWQPLITAAKSDIQYLLSWVAKQPQPYQSDLQVADLMTKAEYDLELNTYEKSYTTAKTNAEKHTAWEAFWKWVGTYATGDGGSSIGLNAQVYFYQHEPSYEARWQEWNLELTNTASTPQAARIAADIALMG